MEGNKYIVKQLVIKLQPPDRRENLKTADAAHKVTRICLVQVSRDHLFLIHTGSEPGGKTILCACSQSEAGFTANSTNYPRK